jgi:hypothetical protein
MAATIDEAPEILPRTDPDVVGGHANHDPGIAEPLFAPRSPNSVVPWKEEMGLPSHGQATVWGPPGGLDHAREGAGWHQQFRQWWGACREAHGRATRAALNCCWEPQRETFRPRRAEAALEMIAAQASFSVVTRLYGLY